MACTLLCATVVRYDPSFSNEVYFTLSSGCPFTPFTFTIQPIHRCHSLRVFVHCAGDFEGCITLSGRFRKRSEGSGCDMFSFMSSPAPPTMHDSRVTLTTLPAARVVSRGVQFVGKGAVLELRLQSCIYKQCAHKLIPSTQNVVHTFLPHLQRRSRTPTRTSNGMQ